MNILLPLLTLAVILEGLILFNPPKPEGLSQTSVSNSVLKKYAEQVFEECSKENHPPSCYDREIPKLMDYISMGDAFRVARFVIDEDPEYVYCHILGHNLSAREVSKDPDNWIQVLRRCPSGMCSNGCLHGGMQERFRAESLTDEQIRQVIPQLANLCEADENWTPTGLEQGSCYHALGHLTMYMTAADVGKATEICKKVSVKEDGRSFLELCYDGVFMQIFQPLEPEDFALIAGLAPEKEGLASFCSQFSEPQREACWREGWPLYFEEIMTPAGLVDFCSKVQNQKRCFNGMYYIVAAQFKLDGEKIIDYCSNMVGQWRPLCFSNSASRMIETDYRLIDRAVRLCKTAEKFNAGDSCWSELAFYATFNFHPGSQENIYLCSQLPDKWQEKCLNKAGQLGQN